MYHFIITALRGRRAIRRKRPDGEPARVGAAWLTGLSDHHLRDIGYIREPDIAPRRHLLRM